MAASGDQLAPVTYLFGDGKAGGPPEAPSSRSKPAFRQSAVDEVDDVVAGEPAQRGDRAAQRAEKAAQRAEKGAQRAEEWAERRAENISLHGLTRRNMSRWELEKLLLSRELEPETVTAELDRLEGAGLVDDAALAETLVRISRERKRLGRQAIIAELRRRHIDEQIIEDALGESEEATETEQERANELACKRAAQLASYDAETAKRRLGGYLMRRGYSGTIVAEATRVALGGRRGGHSGDGHSGHSGVRFE